MDTGVLINGVGAVFAAFAAGSCLVGKWLIGILFLYLRIAISDPSFSRKRMGKCEEGENSYQHTR